MSAINFEERREDTHEHGQPRTTKASVRTRWTVTAMTTISLDSFKLNDHENAEAEETNELLFMRKWSWAAMKALISGSGHSP